MKHMKRVYICFSVLSLCYASVFACGNYNQLPCRPPYPKSCLQEGLEVSGGKCLIRGMNTWRSYPNPSDRSNLEYYKQEDIKSGLDMDSKNIENAIIVSRNTIFKNGRYIYVLRKNDNNLIVRPYDRDTPLVDISFYIKDKKGGFYFLYDMNRNKKNYILTTDGGAVITDRCSQSSHQAPGSKCTYHHVRHSQLNGTTPKDSSGFNNSNAWDQVYCAGELRVHNGKIDRINNESGHFRPTPTNQGESVCTIHVLEVLRALGLGNQLSPNISSHHGQYYDPGTKTYDIKNDANPIFSCQEYPNEEIPKNKGVCFFGTGKAIGRPIRPREKSVRICASDTGGYWVTGDCRVVIHGEL